MGHHLFIVGSKSLAMKDVDILLVRHFLIKGAEKMASLDAVRLIEQWSWLGPGVWTGVNEELLSSKPEIIDAASQCVAGLGVEISSEYLRSEIKVPEGVVWGGPIATAQVVSNFQRLSEYVTAGA